MPTPVPRLRLAAAFVRVVPLVLLAASCRPAAALDASEQCFRDKLRASGLAAARILRCDGAAPCMAKAARRMDHRVASADARASEAGFACPGTSESLGVAGVLPWPARFADELTGSGGNRCNAGQIRAASRFASSYARCLSLRADEGERLSRCIDDARVRFVAAWQHARQASSCPGASVASAMDRIVREIDESAARLEPRCGDGRTAGFEECDDAGNASGDGCTSDCRTETCGRVNGEVRCIECPEGSVPSSSYTSCRCPKGFAGEAGSCTDMDECAALPDACPAERPCVNLEGTWACAIPCTADAFHDALASCGAPTGAIAFDCMDTVIPIPPGGSQLLRENECNDLVIDGAGRNITFELAPMCWQMPLAPEQCPAGLEPDGTCRCPNVDSGDVFVQVRGDRNTIRDLTVRGFFDGIPVRGRDNVVENVRFDRMCDDAFGSVTTGVGNTFRRLAVTRGCDKCSEDGGDLAAADPDPRVARHYHAIFSDVDFDGCRTPVRVATSGRFLFDDVRMHAGDEPDFPCDGPRFSAGDELSKVVVRMTGSEIEGCRRGVRFGQGVEAAISESRIAGSALRGLRVNGTARVSVETTTIENNGGSGSSEPGFGGVALLGSAAVDLGGGTLVIDGAPRSSAGGNTLCGNRTASGAPIDLEMDTPQSVPASGNWWCTTNPFRVAGRILGSAVALPLLDRAPEAYRP